MPALDRNEKVTCEDCDGECRRSDAARHRRRCEKQEEHKCSNCHFCGKKQEETIYHVVKKQKLSSSKQSTVCSSCEKEFAS